MSCHGISLENPSSIAVLQECLDSRYFCLRRRAKGQGSLGLSRNSDEIIALSLSSLQARLVALEAAIN
jgi:hypothetical protein